MKILVVGYDERSRIAESLFRENGHYVLGRHSDIFVDNESCEDGSGFDILIAYPRTEFLDMRVKESMGISKNGILTAWSRISNFGRLHESDILKQRLYDLWFFSYLWGTDISKICIVSQRIPKWGDKVWDVKPTQKIQSTYLWLKGLPKLKRVGDVEQAMLEQWMGGVK